jgi:hypothetical protein
VTGQTTLPVRQLLVYRFGPGAAFEGQLVGALERMESGEALRILDVLFVATDAETGELFAIDLHGGSGGLIAKLLDFRLDPAARRRAAERALGDMSGVAQMLRDLGKTLEPGAALAAVLVEHVWVRVLEDAVSRAGGSRLEGHFVEAETLADLAPELLAEAAADAPEPGHGQRRNP